MKEYEHDYFYAKKACSAKWDDKYYLAYYKKLNYVVPIAFQSSVAIVADLNGGIINDIYRDDPNYSIKDIQICVFPFEENSIVMIFFKNEEKRYRQFFKQFNKLSENDKLSVINFILFSYSEDVFIYKDINTNLINNKHVRNSQTNYKHFN